jgi:hypothetical protein
MMRRKKLIQSAAVAGLFTLGLGSVASGCLNRPLDRVDPRTTSTVVEKLIQTGVDKIDILLAIDNSISMGDKQQILADAVPVLVSRLVEPRCVDDDNNPTGQNVDPAGECPDGSKPEFPPIRDINVGIISSSLGDLTSGACASGSIIHPDDKARLLSRTSSGMAETYQGKGFLAWDPDSKRGGETDAGNLTATLRSMVEGVDQVGCGYEMQLESVLRFLVDPAPYDSIAAESSKLVKSGVDQVLLDQRKDFLRPDSLLAILILSDENDCSVDVSQQGFLALRSQPFFRATSECATDPSDPCCSSCGLPIDAGCDAGGSCGMNGGRYTGGQDHPNLKCFNQKQRYGVNFLYPIQRYVNAFTKETINPNRRDYDGNEDPSEAIDNPIFTDTTGTGSVRSPDLVFVAGIVGVPWQAIAKRDDAGNPDLALGFKTFTELQDDLDALVGNPDEAVPPTDPFMIEDFNQRTGTSAILGASLPGNNDINQGDRTINPAEPDDLQYTCVFPLATPDPDGPDCRPPQMDPALCDPNTPTTQIRAKAYPGLRELALLRGMGSQGIFGSICPENVTGDTSAPDFGYNPAVNTIIDRLKEALGGQCLPRELTVDDSGNVPCIVIEALTSADAGCSEETGRRTIEETLDGQPNPAYNAVLAAQASEFANENWKLFCEIVQLPGNEACLNDPDPKSSAQANGWCYIDGGAETGIPIGNPELVASCPDAEKRLMRFVGAGEGRTGATLIITCSGE